LEGPRLEAEICEEACDWPISISLLKLLITKRPPTPERFSVIAGGYFSTEAIHAACVSAEATGK
jgi:hypothetical protein